MEGREASPVMEAAWETEKTRERGGPLVGGRQPEGCKGEGGGRSFYQEGGPGSPGHS